MSKNPTLEPLGTTVDILRNIVREGLSLADDRIWNYNQKYVIPDDENLFVMVGYKGSKIISSRNLCEMNNKGKLQEYQLLNTAEALVVEVYSRNEEALQRKEEVVMALSSIYSQNIQSQYGMRIFQNAPIEDVSAVEASALLYRYDIAVAVFSWYKKVKLAASYDTFRVKVRANGSSQPDLVRSFDQNKPSA